MSLLKMVGICELNNCQRIALYPAASGAYYFTTFLKNEYPNILSRIVALGDRDSKKHGLQYLGLPILSPQQLSSLKLDAVVVTTILHYEEIERELKTILPANCKIIDANKIAEYIYSASKASSLAEKVDIELTDSELSKLLGPVSPMYLCMPLGRNRYTNGEKGALTYHLLDHIALPKDLRGKRVLDIGASDCFYSYECEARGASEIVAVDKLAWSDPNVMRRLRLTRELYNSQVQTEMLNVEDLESSLEGTFDIVLALGLYYHVKDPFLMFRNLYKCTKERLIISGRTITTLQDGLEEEVPCMIFAHPEAGKWLANCACLKAMLLSAGFSRVEITLDIAPPGSSIKSTALCAYV